MILAVPKTVITRPFQHFMKSKPFVYNKRPFSSCAWAFSKLNRPSQLCSSFVIQVIGQIKEIEENISRLKKAIADKEAPMKLAHTRLDTRTERPNVELCRDAVQYRLIEEVGELEQTLAQLQARLADTEDSLKGLTRNQLDLEDDIQVKSNTLFIDEVECMGMRKSINIQQF